MHEVSGPLSGSQVCLLEARGFLLCPLFLPSPFFCACQRLGHGCRSGASSFAPECGRQHFSSSEEPGGSLSEHCTSPSSVLAPARKLPNDTVSEGIITPSSHARPSLLTSFYPVGSLVTRSSSESPSKQPAAVMTLVLPQKFLRL